MKLIRLLSGSLESEAAEGDSETQIDRKAMLVYAGAFDSMDGPVEITDEHIDLLAKTHNSTLSKIKRMASGDVPAKFYPPIQLDHSTSATMTVGRLRGDLHVGAHPTADGDKKALFGTVRFLGKENVERVKDGRWTHLSIGADLDSGKLNELSVTPFPAAPDASLLAAKKAEVIPGDTVKYEAIKAKIKTLKEQLGDMDAMNASGRQKFEIEMEIAQMECELERCEGKRMASTEMPGKPDEALWQKAKDAYEQASKTETIDDKWAFIMGWYKKNGGKLAAMAAEHPVTHPADHVSPFKVGDKVRSKVDAMAGMIPKGSVSEVQVVGDGNHMAKRYLRVQGGDIPRGYVYHEDHLECHMDDPQKLSKECTMDKEKLKKHLVEHHKMSSDDAEKTLGEMDDEKKSKLAAEVDEHEKKMAADKEAEEKKLSDSENEAEDHLASDEEKKEEEKKLAAAKAQFVTLAKDFRKSQGDVQLSARKMKIQTRLMGLRSAARITPAEMKKIDIAKLATANDVTVEAVFKSYEDREPVIPVGVYGSSKAVDIARLTKQAEMKNLTAETIANMPSLKKAMEGKHLAEGGVVEGPAPAPVHAEEAPHKDIHAAYDHLRRLVEEGKHEEALEHLKKHMAYAAHYAAQDAAPVGPEHMEGVEKGMASMQKQFDGMLKLMSTIGQIEENDLQ